MKWEKSTQNLVKNQNSGENEKGAAVVLFGIKVAVATEESLVMKLRDKRREHLIEGNHWSASRS